MNISLWIQHPHVSAHLMPQRRPRNEPLIERLSLCPAWGCSVPAARTEPNPYEVLTEGKLEIELTLISCTQFPSSACTTDAWDEPWGRHSNCRDEACDNMDVVQWAFCCLAADFATRMRVLLGSIIMISITVPLGDQILDNLSSWKTVLSSRNTKDVTRQGTYTV